MDIDAQGRKDPNGLQYDVQEAVELVVLVSYAELTREARSLSHVDELSERLLGRSVGGCLPTAKSFPVAHVGLIGGGFGRR